jgi:hypothetical protein
MLVDGSVGPIDRLAAFEGAGGAEGPMTPLSSFSSAFCCGKLGPVDAAGGSVGPIDGREVGFGAEGP